MRWFASADEADDPDVTELRAEISYAPGWSPGRIMLCVVFGGLLLTVWMILPLSSWVSWVWKGFGQSGETSAKIAARVPDDPATDSLQSHHVPKRPAQTVAAPIEPPPSLSVADDFKAKYDQLAQQYADLEAWIKGQAKPIQHTPQTAPAKTIVRKDDEAAKKRQEEARRKREAFGRSEPIFLTRKKEDGVGQLHALKSPYSLAPSEVIPIKTTMEISSDTPGAFVAIVREDVPNTATRRHNVIPMGSKFVLKPQGKLIFGDSRIPIQTQTLTFPGGSWLKMPAHTVTDRAGTAGFTGTIDRHLLRIYGTVILTRVLESGSTVATGGYSGGVGERVGASVGQGVASETSRQARQSLQTGPTITVPAEYEGLLLLEDELVLTRSFGAMR